MASLVARALMEESSHGEELDSRRGVDRVLLGTFWRPTALVLPAPVLSMNAPRLIARRSPTRR